MIVPVNLRVGADVTMTYTMTGHADIGGRLFAWSLRRLGRHLG